MASRKLAKKNTKAALGSIPEPVRAELKDRLDRFLDAHYPPSVRGRVSLSFRGAVVTMTLKTRKGPAKIGILRWTGNPNVWRYGHWMGSKYSRFWIGGRERTPPEWGLALGLCYADHVAPLNVKPQYLLLSATDIEPWVIGLDLPVGGPKTSAGDPGEEE
jgi:hypothetical protein